MNNPWGDFDGLRFVAKIGIIEKAKEGSVASRTRTGLEACRGHDPDRKAWVKLSSRWLNLHPSVNVLSRLELPPRPAVAEKANSGGQETGAGILT